MSLTEQEQANLNRISELLAELNTISKGVQELLFAPIAPVEETKHPLDNLSQGAGYVLGKIAVEEKVEKPPLGIIPCKLWIEDRLTALNEAMERYEGTPYGIPVDWIEEAAWLQKEYNTKYPVNTIAQTEWKEGEVETKH